MSQRKVIALGAMAELYRRELSEATVRMYVAASQQLSNDEFEQAIASLCSRSRFMPTPAELIEYTRTGGLSYEAQAHLAFEELDSALTKNRPSLMSPLVAAIARQIGGFQALREMNLDEFKTWKRKDFIAAHTTLSQENPNRVAALAGPSSEIGQALLGLKKIPSREDCEKLEAKNRKRLQYFSTEVRETDRACKAGE